MKKIKLTLLAPIGVMMLVINLIDSRAFVYGGSNLGVPTLKTKSVSEVFKSMYADILYPVRL